MSLAINDGYLVRVMPGNSLGGAQPVLKELRFKTLDEVAEHIAKENHSRAAILKENKQLIETANGHMGSPGHEVIRRRGATISEVAVLGRESYPTRLMPSEISELDRKTSAYAIKMASGISSGIRKAGEEVLEDVAKQGRKLGSVGKIVAAGVAGTLAVAGGANAAEAGVAALDAVAPGLGTLTLGEGPKKGKLCGAFGQAGGALAGVGAGLVGTGVAGPLAGVGAGMLVEAGATPALTAGCERVVDGPLANGGAVSYSQMNGANIGHHRPSVSVPRGPGV